MFSLLLMSACLSINEESYVLWARTGRVSDVITYPDTGRTDLPSKSGSKYSYNLKFEDTDTVVLEMIDSGAMPNSVLTPNWREQWKLSQGDVFPIGGRLYVVKKLDIDKHRHANKPEHDQSQIVLQRWQADQTLHPGPQSLTISSRTIGPCGLLRWQSPAVENAKDGVSVSRWTFDGGDSVTVNFRRYEFFDRRKRPEYSEHSLSLTEGDVFEVNGQSIRLQQIVRPRVIDKDHKLTGWISFVAVEENDAGVR